LLPTLVERKGKLVGLGSPQSDHRSIFNPSCALSSFFFLTTSPFNVSATTPRSFSITNQLQSRPTLIQSRQHGQRTRVSIHHDWTVSNFRIGRQHTTLRKLLTHSAESTSTACRHLRTGFSTNCRAPTPPRPRPVPTSSETACL
jgi:hypothetical protein